MYRKLYKSILCNKMFARSGYLFSSILLIGSSMSAYGHPDYPHQHDEMITGGVIGVAFSSGGDELARETVDSTFGGSDSESIDAGELFHIYGGIHIGDEQLQLQTTIGYQADRIRADNGDTGFYRYPLEIIGFTRLDRLRLGVGLSHHLSPRYERDIYEDPNETVEFKNATGLVLQADYLFGEWGSTAATVGIRYTNIEYEIESSNINVERGRTFDGSNVGLSIGLLF